MARGRAHSDQTRAAVMAALLAGQGVEEVANQYELPKSTVSDWKAKIDSGEIELLRTKKEASFGDLLATYLRETLTTLAEHQRMARDPEWFGRQTASEIGTMDGISCDKAIRLLEAAERAEQGDSTDAG